MTAFGFVLDTYYATGTLFFLLAMFMMIKFISNGWKF